MLRFENRFVFQESEKSTTPARPFIFSMSDGFVVWPPLLQKEGKLLSPKLLKFTAMGFRGKRKKRTFFNNLKGSMSPPKVLIKNYF